LEYATLGYNVVEAAVALSSGAAASSVALIGFGIDSILEVSSGLVMVWRLGKTNRESERRAQQLIALSFFGLGAWLLVKSLHSLWLREAPEESWTGIALAITSLLVMPLLARAKRRVGNTLGSAAMVADSKQTELCAYLSAILLAGLALNAAFGWWWADSLAGLVMAPIVFREGRQAWRGEGCCSACH
jgi:divalent metal cation (Fe/Co/Zn/Cd) transporter